MTIEDALSLGERGSDDRRAARRSGARETRRRAARVLPGPAHATDRSRSHRHDHAPRAVPPRHRPADARSRQPRPGRRAHRRRLVGRRARRTSAAAPTARTASLRRDASRTTRRGSPHSAKRARSSRRSARSPTRGRTTRSSATSRPAGSSTASACTTSSSRASSSRSPAPRSCRARPRGSRSSRRSPTRASPIGSPPSTPTSSSSRLPKSPRPPASCREIAAAADDVRTEPERLRVFADLLVLVEDSTDAAHAAWAPARRARPSDHRRPRRDRDAGRCRRGAAWARGHRRRRHPAAPRPSSRGPRRDHRPRRAACDRSRHPARTTSALPPFASDSACRCARVATPDRRSRHDPNPSKRQIHLAAHFPGVNNTTVWTDPTAGQPDRLLVVRVLRPQRRARSVRLPLPRRGPAPARAPRAHPRPRRRSADRTRSRSSPRSPPSPSTSDSSARSAPPSTSRTNSPGSSATLDHLSGGRAGWNAVTSSDAFHGANFRRGGYLDHADRYTARVRVRRARQAAVGVVAGRRDRGGCRDRRLPRRRRVGARSARQPPVRRSTPCSTCRHRRRAAR